MVIWCGAKLMAYGKARAGQEVAYSYNQCLGVGSHVGSVGVEQVIPEEGMFVAARYGLDKVFLVGGREE